MMDWPREYLRGDTLDDAHVSVYDAETNVLVQINEGVRRANDRLDKVVEQYLMRDVFEHWYGAAGGPPLRAPASFRRGPRSTSEQRRLYDIWKGRTNPDGIVIPGQSVHSWPTGVAVDLGVLDSDPSWFDNAGRHVSDFNEPWHFGWRPTNPMTRRAHFRANREAGYGFWRSLWWAVTT